MADIERYKKKGFVLFVMNSEYENHQDQSPWNFFESIHVVDEKVISEIPDINKKEGMTFITRELAKQLGLK